MARFFRYDNDARLPWRQAGIIQKVRVRGRINSAPRAARYAISRRFQ